MNLDDVTIGHSIASGNIYIMGKVLDECRVINQEFYETLEEVLHGKEYLKFNVRGRFFNVRMEPA